MSQTAKVFKTGRSQAVRLPMEYRFEGTEVFIRRDPTSGDVVLSPKPLAWIDFFALADREVSADFMNERADLPAEERDVF